jgi:hypothetical protein
LEVSRSAGFSLRGIVGKNVGVQASVCEAIVGKNVGEQALACEAIEAVCHNSWSAGFSLPED